MQKTMTTTISPMSNQGQNIKVYLPNHEKNAKNYAVERIVGQKRTRKGITCHVLWYSHNHCDDTYEPAPHNPFPFIRRYWSRQTGAKNVSSLSQRKINNKKGTTNCGQRAKQKQNCRATINETFNLKPFVAPHAYVAVNTKRSHLPPYNSWLNVAFPAATGCYKLPRAAYLLTTQQAREHDHAKLFTKVAVVDLCSEVRFVLWSKTGLRCGVKS